MAAPQGRSCVTPDERWLAAAWPFVSDQLPPAPAGVLEVGCGPLGGFVPALLGGGYEVVGVDPEAPEGPGYHQVEFERYQSPKPVECVVASTSLHHVADLDEVLDRVKTTLVADGVLVVEWAWERFDEATARWCFARLAPPASAAEPGWLHGHQQRWVASGQPWDAHCRAWATAEGLHTGREILRGLDARFERRLCTFGPYFFPDLADTTEADEQAAIDAGQIQATGIRYAGRLPQPSFRSCYRFVGLGLVAYQHVRERARLVEFGDGTGSVTLCGLGGCAHRGGTPNDAPAGLPVALLAAGRKDEAIEALLAARQWPIHVFEYTFQALTTLADALLNGHADQVIAAVEPMRGPEPFYRAGALVAAARVRRLRAAGAPVPRARRSAAAVSRHPPSVRCHPPRSRHPRPPGGRADQRRYCRTAVPVGADRRKSRVLAARQTRRPESNRPRRPPPGTAAT
jgi:SAM-dependent methyltransferase